MEGLITIGFRHLLGSGPGDAAKNYCAVSRAGADAVQLRLGGLVLVVTRRGRAASFFRFPPRLSFGGPDGLLALRQAGAGRAWESFVHTRARAHTAERDGFSISNQSQDRARIVH
jgi:hypothetical protein